ncbi:PaaI family thioesterase [Gordonia hirsuta]|nr:PaaI family thioesterase [Gordonia hirsuta]
MTRHPKVPGPGEPMRVHHSMCFGCGLDAPVGLRLNVTAGEDFCVTATMPVVDWMQGGPGVIHGGILSAAFDEVMGNASILIGVPVVTVNLEIDYAKPIPLGSTLRFTAEVLGKSGRKVYVRSQAYLDGFEAPVAAAYGIFVEINLRKHFEGYKEGAVKAPQG